MPFFEAGKEGPQNHFNVRPGMLFLRLVIVSRVRYVAQRAFSVLVVVLLLGASYSDAAKLSTRETPQLGSPDFDALPLKRSRQNHLLVRAYINGRPAWLGVDSGAPFSAIAVHRKAHFRVTGIAGNPNLPTKVQVNGALNNLGI